MDSDWLLMFFIICQLDEIVLKVIPTILFLYAVIIKAVVWTPIFFNIDKDF